MSILFVLLIFLVIISFNHVCFRPPQSLPATQRPIHPPTPLMTRLAGFNIPKDYSFHPGHTWVLRESGTKEKWNAPDQSNPNRYH